MKIDQNKLRQLIARQFPAPSPDQLRREDNVFFVGGNLPERQTLETLFESHFQCHAALFHLTFGNIESFHNGEILARMIKKNFNVHLVGRLDYAAPSHLVERAYAAGVDILDIPLPTSAPGNNVGHNEVDERLRSLDRARSVFPRWSVISSVAAGEGSAASTVAGIDTLLALDVVPLVTVSRKADDYPPEELYGVYDHLNNGLRNKKAAIRPLLPLIILSTPLVPASPRGVVRGFIDAIDDRRLLAASDLRRVLRVKEVEESFESSGL